MCYSFAFDSAHVKYGVWTWPKSPGFVFEENPLIIVTPLFSKSSLLKIFLFHVKMKRRCFQIYSASSLKSFFEKRRLRDGLAWTVALTGERKLYFQIPPGVVWILPSILSNQDLSFFFTFITPLHNTPSSETQGLLAGMMQYFWAKVYFKSWRAPGNLFLPNQFQRRSNSVPLIGQKNIFLSNQQWGLAG